MKSKENKIVEEVLEDFKARSLQRKPFEISWQINMNFLMGNQYCNIGYGGELEESEKGYFWQEREIFNHIAPIYDVRCAKLFKSKPHFVVVPATNDERDKQASKVSKKILDSVQYKLGMENLIEQAIKWSEVCGTAFYKVTWNSESGQLIAKDENGKDIRGGEVEVEVVSPFEIFPDSSTCEDISECQSIIHARVLSVSQIKAMYGIDVVGKTINCYSLDNVVSGLGGLGYNATATKLIEGAKSNSGLVLEKYIRPNTEYPDGRLIIVAGDRLVYDGALPYLCGEDKLRDFPFVRQISLEKTGCFWGSSVIERLIPVQRAYNAVKNRKHEFINRLTLGVLSVEDGSVDLDNLEDEGLCPGKVLVYRQGANAPRYLNGEAIPAGFADEEEKLLDEFNRVSGVSDTLGTDYMNSNMSGTALELMIGQDEVRLNTTSHSIRAAALNVMKKVLRLYKQFALFPRLARIIGENGQIESFYFSSNDISSDDVVIDTQGDASDSLTTRRDMIFNLLNAGVLYDEEGKLTNRMKGKILEMLGLGLWQNAQDVQELHIKKAGNENLKMLSGINVNVSEIDDHDLHISEHIAFMLGSDYENAKQKNAKLESLYLNHIKEHKKLQKMED